MLYRVNGSMRCAFSSVPTLACRAEGAKLPLMMTDNCLCRLIHHQGNEEQIGPNITAPSRDVVMNIVQENASIAEPLKAGSRFRFARDSPTAEAKRLAHLGGIRIASFMAKGPRRDRREFAVAFTRALSRRGPMHWAQSVLLLEQVLKEMAETQMETSPPPTRRVLAGTVVVPEARWTAAVLRHLTDSSTQGWLHALKIYAALQEEQNCDVVPASLLERDRTTGSVQWSGPEVCNAVMSVLGRGRQWLSAVQLAEQMTRTPHRLAASLSPKVFDTAVHSLVLGTAPHWCVAFEVFDALQQRVAALNSTPGFLPVEPGSDTYRWLLRALFPHRCHTHWELACRLVTTAEAVYTADTIPDVYEGLRRIFLEAEQGRKVASDAFAHFVAHRLKDDLVTPTTRTADNPWWKRKSTGSASGPLASDASELRAMLPSIEKAAQRSERLHLTVEEEMKAFRDPLGIVMRAAYEGGAGGSMKAARPVLNYIDACQARGRWAPAVGLLGKFALLSRKGSTKDQPYWVSPVVCVPRLLKSSLTAGRWNHGLFYWQRMGGFVRDEETKLLWDSIPPNGPNGGRSGMRTGTTPSLLKLNMLRYRPQGLPFSSETTGLLCEAIPHCLERKGWKTALLLLRKAAAAMQGPALGKGKLHDSFVLVLSTLIRQHRLSGADSPLPPAVVSTWYWGQTYGLASEDAAFAVLLACGEESKLEEGRRPKGLRAQEVAESGSVALSGEVTGKRMALEKLLKQYCSQQ